MKRQHIDEALAAWGSGRPLFAGRAIYEHLRREHRPLWAADVLDVFQGYSEDDQLLGDIITMARTPTRWHEGHDAFRRVRARTAAATSEAEGSVRGLTLRLAESVAKVAYNATGLPGPFDHNAGWRIGSVVYELLSTLEDVDLRCRAWYVFTCERFA